MNIPGRSLIHVSWRVFASHWLGTLLGLLATVTAVFGLLGFGIQHHNSVNSAVAEPTTNGVLPLQVDWTIPVYKTVQLFLLNSGAEDDASHRSNWLLMIARLSAAGLFLVISSAVILRIVDQIRVLPRQLTRKNHIVICGFGRIGHQLLQDLQQQDRDGDVVVVDRSEVAIQSVGQLRSRTTCVIGDAARADVLQEARAEHAREIFIATGDDGVNIEIARELLSLTGSRRVRSGRLRVFVQISDSDLAVSLPPFLGNSTEDHHIEFQVFNIHRNAAIQVITQELWKCSPRSTDEVSHFAILGFGPMGQVLSLELARLAHFQNCRRSRFTIADKFFPTGAQRFVAKYGRFTFAGPEDGAPIFGNDKDDWAITNTTSQEQAEVVPPPAATSAGVDFVASAKFIDQPGGVVSELLVRGLVDDFSRPGVRPAVFVCGEKDGTNFDSAIRVSRLLADCGICDIPIFVWLPTQPALATAIRQNGRLIPFGTMRGVAGYHEITNPVRKQIGPQLHAAYKLIADAEAVLHNRSDRVQTWNQLDEELRESNRQAADHLHLKLAALGLRIRRTPEKTIAKIRLRDHAAAVRELLSKMEHNRWMAERLLAGWRYAPRPADESAAADLKLRRYNWNLVAWPDLPGKEQRKDLEQLDAALQACQENGFCLERIPNGE